MRTIVTHSFIYHACAMTDLAVDAEGLSRRYGRRWALAGVSVTVEAGEVLMVAGRNGSGKSTLLRILATAIRADAGRARVAGFDLVRERDDVRQATALLTHASYLYDSLTARENLDVLVSMRGRGDVDAALERVGLAARAEDLVHGFSAGMRKRLSLARILLQEPRVVFLDEPYGALDPPGFVLIDDLVRGLQRDGVTVLMATHQLERGANLASRAILLENGRLRWSGSAQETPAWD